MLAAELKTIHQPRAFQRHNERAATEASSKLSMNGIGLNRVGVHYGN